MEVLEYAEIPSLPKEHSGGAIWVKAVAKITTMVGSQSYAIVINDGGETPRVVKVFDTLGISSIDHIHPYQYLDNSALEALKKADDVKSLIVRAYGLSPFEVEKLSKKELTKLFIRFAVRKQLKEEKERRIEEKKRNSIKIQNDEQGADTE